EGRHRGRIYVIPEHAAAVSRAISAAAGGQEAVQLRRGTRITGRLTLRDGSAAAGVAGGGEGDERGPHRHPATGAGGRDTTAPLPAGDYDVRPTDQFVDFQTGQKAGPLPAVFTGLKVTLPKDGPAVTADFVACETVRLTAHYMNCDGIRSTGQGFSISG